MGRQARDVGGEERAVVHGQDASASGRPSLARRPPLLPAAGSGGGIQEAARRAGTRLTPQARAVVKLNPAQAAGRRGQNSASGEGGGGAQRDDEAGGSGGCPGRERTRSRREDEGGKRPGQGGSRRR
jgi:hypothetical protein